MVRARKIQKKPVMDVWNRMARNLWRSDVVILPQGGYNETYAASEVSWVIVVPTLRRNEGPTLISSKLKVDDIRYCG